MSAASSSAVALSSKAEKSKKFQSLNINNLYQGSTNKPLQRSVPQKHGLQSLGKVPTARRAPANLPSLKAENHGNDGGPILLPSAGSTGANGQGSMGMGNGMAGGSGWVGGKDELAYTDAKSAQQHLDVSVGDGVGPDKKRAPIDDVVNSSTAEKSSWGGGGKAASSRTDSKSKSFLNQRSPLFGQEFPSLGDGGSASPGEDTVMNSGVTGIGPSAVPVGPAGGFSSVAAAVTSSTGQVGGAADAKYGPGPSLRPQTSGNWLHGGVVKMENGGTPLNSGVGISSGTADGPPSIVGGNSGAVVSVGGGSSRLVDAFLHKPPPSSTLPAPVLPQFDVSLKGPQAVPLPQGLARKISISRTGGGSSLVPSGNNVGLRPRGGATTQGPGKSGYSSQQQRERERDMQTFKEHSIIDDEKLKRMDILEVTEDDWTKSDDNFDYNKKLKRFATALFFRHSMSSRSIDDSCLPIAFVKFVRFDICDAGFQVGPLHIVDIVYISCIFLADSPQHDDPVRAGSLDFSIVMTSINAFFMIRPASRVSTLLSQLFLPAIVGPLVTIHYKESERTIYIHNSQIQNNSGAFSIYPAPISKWKIPGDPASLPALTWPALAWLVSRNFRI